MNPKNENWKVTEDEEQKEDGRVLFLYVLKIISGFKSKKSVLLLKTDIFYFVPLFFLLRARPWLLN